MPSPGDPGPKSILITTSRRPSPRVRSFIKDLALILPGAMRLNRGHLSMKDLAIEAQLVGADRVVIVGEKRGNPGIIRVYKVSRDTLVNIVSFIIKGVALSRETGAGHPSKGTPLRLIVDTDGSPIADEFADAFVLAFHARVLEDPRPSDVFAKITRLDDRNVKVEFFQEDRRVGPRLKLGKPAVMVKASEGQGPN